MTVLTKTAIAGVAALAAIGATGCSSGSSKTAKNAVLKAASTNGVTPGPTINVAGHGKVEGTPDVMTVTMGVQTVDLNVSPKFDKNFHVTGYSASNTVTAKLRDLAKAGEVIDAAALTAGEDVRLQGVSFSIDNTSALVAKARADAIKDALAQGKQLASAAKVTLGPIRTIDDTGTLLPQPQFLSGATATRQAAADVAVEPGSQQLSVDVTVVFDITP